MPLATAGPGDTGCLQKAPSGNTADFWGVLPAVRSWCYNGLNHIYFTDSSDELCLQLSVFHLFALLSEAARRLIRNVIPVKPFLQPTEIGFFAEEM